MERKTKMFLGLYCKSEDNRYLIELALKSAPFNVDSTNDEFHCLTFNCAFQDDAGALEKELTAWLNENGFDNYYFESED